ncbi:MAG TPA: SAM-dependent methyltransferase, partial [Cytophagales bacterium]|nr:SAM-dependent methyltransferase [Cytophagales bacterium]
AGIAQAQVYEVDRRSVQQYKKAKVKKWQSRLPPHVTFVEVDFDTQTLEETLGSYFTLDREEPTLFLWEGVTQYITEEAVRQTFAFLSTFDKADVVMSYVPQEYLNGTSDLPYLPKLLEGLAQSGRSWHFGIAPEQLPEFVQPYGYTVREDVGHEEHQTRYLEPAQRKMLVAPIERIVWLRRG